VGLRSEPRTARNRKLIECELIACNDTRIPAILDPLAWDIYRFTVANALARPNVAAVSRHFACSPRQLERRFEQRLLPPPQRLVVLARWLPVVEVLGSRSVPTRDIAGALAFTVTQRLYRAALRELRMPVPELRQQEAPAKIVGDLLTAYQRQIRDDRVEVDRVAVS